MKLRNARVSAGLSVSDVMRELGVSDAAVYQWETGQTQPKVANLVKLAKLYGCSVDDLIDDERGE